MCTLLSINMDICYSDKQRQHNTVPGYYLVCFMNSINCLLLKQLWDPIAWLNEQWILFSFLWKLLVNPKKYLLYIQVFALNMQYVLRQFNKKYSVPSVGFLWTRRYIYRALNSQLSISYILYGFLWSYIKFIVFLLYVCIFTCMC